MKKSQEKYIVYLHQEYVDLCCHGSGIETLEGRENIRRQFYDVVTRFLRGESTKSTLMTDIFINSKGEPTKAIEIYRLSNGAQVKNLKELKQLIFKQTKRGYIELKK